MFRECAGCGIGGTTLQNFVGFMGFTQWINILATETCIMINMSYSQYISHEKILSFLFTSPYLELMMNFHPPSL